MEIFDDVYIPKLICFVLFILGIGILIGVFLPNPNVEALGQAICEEEYGMDFEDYKGYLYEGGTLKCKLPKEDSNYDGLNVMIDKVK